ncbi:MAG: hypothetical protein ACI9VT_004272 [Psychroserpens sp.]|jgi:hypothetical protein
METNLIKLILLGFDAIADAEDPNFAKALETSIVCENPYNNVLIEVNGKLITMLNIEKLNQSSAL